MTAEADRLLTDFYLSHDFNERAQMIALGEQIGQILKATGREQPWMIRLDGDFNSGKSLMALAIDMGFRPAAYPDGLGHGVYIETIMPDWFKNKPESLPSVFKHFGHAACPTRELFDRELATFESKNPQAEILFAANLDRNSEDNEIENGLDSDRLDLSVHMLKTGTGYQRHVDIIARNPAIITALR